MLPCGRAVICYAMLHYKFGQYKGQCDFWRIGDQLYIGIVRGFARLLDDGCLLII